MKTLYLSNGKGGWMPFQYENINDINEQLTKRNIVIGNYVKIGDCAVIGNKVIQIRIKLKQIRYEN